MSMQQILQKEIEIPNFGLTEKNMKKRIGLMIWVLENMNNDGTDICKIIENRMDEIIMKIKKTDSIYELDPLDSELRILNWILYQVCSNEIKNI
jgi:hypothetical protein